MFQKKKKRRKKKKKECQMKLWLTDCRLREDQEFGMNRKAEWEKKDGRGKIGDEGRDRKRKK